MANVINSKKLCGNTESECIQFGYTKRCEDGILRTFYIIGSRNIFNNKYIFSLKIEKLRFMYLMNIIGIIAEFYFLIHYMKFMLIIYAIFIFIKTVTFIIVFNNLSLRSLHGAEHMMINSYTIYNKKVEMEDIKKQSIISYKCGSIIYMTQVIAFIFILITKFPIPLGLISYILFIIKPISKLLALFELLTVEKPDEEQLLLAKSTFDLLIEAMEQGLEDEEEIKKYIEEYSSSYNEDKICRNI